MPPRRRRIISEDEDEADEDEQPASPEANLTQDEAEVDEEEEEEEGEGEEEEGEEEEDDGEDMNVDDEEEDEEDEEELEQENVDELEEEEMDEDAEDEEEVDLSTPHTAAAGSSLRIKLKLPSGPSKNVEVESEDTPAVSPGVSDESEPEVTASRTLTARQMALASGAEVEHVSLGPTSRKNQLTGAEIALRREEMLRRRKNRSEKRLEDEKAETINRLLKKQARPRAKKGTSTAVTPSAADTHTPSEDAEASSEKAEVSPAEVVIPYMWRWVSTSKRAQTEGEVAQEGRVLAIPINAPVLVSDAPSVPSGDKKKVNCACPITPTCENPPKYRSTVKHDLWACSMDHLKQVNASLVQT